jgi:hypothetical protein
MKVQDKVYFYIYAPAYRENSAGIRVLYMLCDGLNRSELSSWIVQSNPNEKHDSHNLNCPILDMETLIKHQESCDKVIVVYSETVVGNPLRATNVIRYYLNFPGALGGTKHFDEREIKLAYSKKISSSLQGDFNVLFIPAIDPLTLPNFDRKSDFSLIYAGKYRAFKGQPIANYENPCYEIFRDGPKKQPRKEVLELLSQAKQIYVWENSTIATEAILLNTPVIFMRSDFLSEVIAEYELGKLGYTFETDPISIENARNEIQKAKSIYLEVWRNYPNEIEKVKILYSGDPRRLKPQEPKIKIPRNGVFVNLHRFRLFISISRNMGFSHAIRVTREFGYLRFKRLRGGLYE